MLQQSSVRRTAGHNKPATRAASAAGRCEGCHWVTPHSATIKRSGHSITPLLPSLVPLLPLVAAGGVQLVVVPLEPLGARHRVLHTGQPHTSGQPGVFQSAGNRHRTLRSSAAHITTGPRVVPVSFRDYFVLPAAATTNEPCKVGALHPCNNRQHPPARAEKTAWQIIPHPRNAPPHRQPTCLAASLRLSSSSAATSLTRAR